MARPLKSGLDYLPLDVHDDDKLKFIRIKFKVTGVAIVFELYRKIYAANFFTKWSDDEALMFSDSIKADYDLVKEVITECLTREIFDFEKFREHNILTSKGIQDRFAEATSRRASCVYNFKFFINGSRMYASRGKYTDIDGVNVDNNLSTSVVNDSRSTQSKVKESKVKESKEEKKEKEKEKEEKKEKEKKKEKKEETLNTLSNPADKTVQKITNASDDLDFMDFYDRYGVKKGRDAAWKAWKKLSKADQVEAFEKVEHYFSTIKEGISKVHPSTYLNAQRWTDELCHDITKPKLSTGMENMQNNLQFIENDHLEIYTEPQKPTLPLGDSYDYR